MRAARANGIVKWERSFRQPALKERPTAGVVGGCDAATVSLDDLSGDGETEACTSDPGCDERLKDVELFSFRDPFSRVSNGEQELTTLEINSHRDDAVGRRCLERILKEVGDDTFHRDRIERPLARVCADQRLNSIVLKPGDDGVEKLDGVSGRFADATRSDE